MKKPTEDNDYQLALKLQAEMDKEEADNSRADDADDSVSFVALDMSKNNKRPRKPPVQVSCKCSVYYICQSHNEQTFISLKPKRTKQLMDAPSLPPPSHDSYLDQTQNLVHPQWELVDPTPDIFAMFVRFDEKFFQRRLGAVTVEWSKRMYTCAGICYQRGNRYVKEIIIRISEPLLKLRPRKDLVETLLVGRTQQYFGTCTHA